MEGDGLVVREVFAEVPPGSMGYTLRPVIAVMLEWGVHYKERMA
jgi:DNA-binding HxlR family transcriptional regulator